jgi:hypothetical protein
LVLVLLHHHPVTCRGGDAAGGTPAVLGMLQGLTPLVDCRVNVNALAKILLL